MKQNDIPTLYLIARESFDSAKHDESRALRLMMDRVRHDKTLAESVLRTACETELAQVRSVVNRSAWNDSGPASAIQHDKSQQGHRVEILARWSLMDTILPDGIRLGDARKHDVEQASGFFAKRAATEAHKSRWLALIAKKLGSQKVEEALDETNLRKLQKDAEDE